MSVSNLSWASFFTYRTISEVLENHELYPYRQFLLLPNVKQKLANYVLQRLRQEGVLQIPIETLSQTINPPCFLPIDHCRLMAIIYEGIDRLIAHSA